MIDRRKVCPVFLLIPFFRAANSRRKMRNKLRILTDTGRRRRQVLLVLTLVTSAIHFRAEVRPRPACSLPRPEGWFKLMLNAPIYNYDLYWRKHSRMSRRTFQFVVNLVRNSVEKRDSRFREAASIEKRVAVALWRLASGNAYRTVASTFGIGKSTAVEITNSFIHILNELYEDWITFPAPVQETDEAIQRFSDNNLFNIPQILGAIDGSHIPIKAPKHNKESYFNRKHFYSVNLQAVVGFDGRFLDF